MFCKNCGKEVDGNAVVCPHCGVQINKLTDERKPTCTMAIVGLVLSFIIPLVGLICSIIARKKCREEELEGGGLALAGIIISAVLMALGVIYLIVFISLFSGFASMLAMI